jgi:hypothetical protein
MLGLTLSYHRQELCFKKLAVARYWWLTPVILATREAEISRIEIKG